MHFDVIKNVKFHKAYKKIDKKYIKFLDRTIIRLFYGPPFEKEYNVHSLNGKYDRYYSINVTGDYRIIFKIDKDKKIIYLYDIGTHSQLYK